MDSTGKDLKYLTMLCEVVDNLAPYFKHYVDDICATEYGDD